MRILLFLTFVLLSTAVFSQKIANDTVSERYTKSNWAFRANLGTGFQTQLGETAVGSAVGYSLFYKSLFFSFQGTNAMEFKQDDYELHYMNTTLGLGYSVDLFEKWGADIFAGYSKGEYGKSTKNDQGYSSNSLYCTSDGLKIGVGLDRYFKLKRNNYIVLRVFADYYSIIEYKDLDESFESDSRLPSYADIFGKDYLVYGLSLCYKGWFRKIVR